MITFEFTVVLWPNQNSFVKVLGIEILSTEITCVFLIIFFLLSIHNCRFSFTILTLITSFALRYLTSIVPLISLYYLIFVSLLGANANIKPVVAARRHIEQTSSTPFALTRPANLMTYQNLRV